MFICPGDISLINPPELPISVLSFVIAGKLPKKILSDGFDHGEAITGVHGCGVKTPKAAAVAAETAGLPIELHIPNGAIFVIGTLSVMQATGCPHITTFLGAIFKFDGANPKEHCN